MGKDAVEINTANGVVKCKLEEDKAKSIPELLKLQEENRRERQRRIDAGDETVRLNFEVLRQQSEQQLRTGAMNTARVEVQKRQGGGERERYEQARADRATQAKIPFATGGNQNWAYAPRTFGKGGKDYG